MPENVDSSPAPDSEMSGLQEAVDVLGDRWSLLVVEALMQGALRFGQLEERVAGVAPNILSARLKALERAGLVIAEPYQDRPVRYGYELSAAGRELAGAIRMLASWGARQSGLHGPRHSTCGGALEAHWYCPTCEQLVEAGDSESDASETDPGVEWV